MDATYLIGELITIGTMAFAFSMDSFSLGLGMGMLRLTFRRMALLAILSGAFHVIMPSLGILLGKILSDHFGNVALIFSGFLLLFIGGMMVKSFFQAEHASYVIPPYGLGLLLFPITVSLDSVSAGLSLGIFGARVLITIILFGLISSLLTLAGLMLGRKFHHILGTFSLAVGGAILIAFGIKIIAPLMT